ncbi:MAG: hypothetical protein ACJA0N_000720 [Pseudohongiellaceae bacterium]|jgi:hypothetical protein
MAKNGVVAGIVIGIIIGITAGIVFSKNYLIKDFEIRHIPTLSFADGGVYSGPIDAAGLASGQGRMEWGNGTVYTGAFKDGLYHGLGVFEDATGFRVEGAYTKGIANGEAVISYNDGLVYRGNVSGDLFQGQGKLSYPNGDYYEGEFQADKITGQGRWVAKNTHVYNGGVKDGLFEGQGEIVYESGDKYIGQFKAGQFHGQGIYDEEDGRVYSGIFIEDEFTGQGSYKNINGYNYVGQFKNWLGTGEGISTDSDGNQYKGTFENGSLHGEGVYIGQGQLRYEGTFKNGKYNGEGSLVDGDGNRYQGEFSYGSMHGKGEYTYNKPVDGVTAFSGTWRNGKLDTASNGLQVYSRNELSEFALYNQIPLLEKQLAKVASGDNKKIELYTLGVAAYGSEEVFTRELNFIENYFEQHFANQPQPIYLGNSRRSLDKRPLATITSVKRSLSTLAAKMNVDQDILFLYITSHGSEDKTLSFEQKGLSLPDLSADELDTLLDESGIKWKVVVISACYSGGFIEVLEDDHTLILTSAASDKTSFGCSDDRLFTYFGKAFFKEALPQANSFVEAFDMAAAMIKDWETEQDITASNPQISSPKLITSYLQQWRKQLYREASLVAELDVKIQQRQQ